MSIRATEVRAALHDADLESLLAGDGFDAWKRMTERVAGEWHGDVADRVHMAAGEIAGLAMRRWPEIVADALEREALRAEGYASIRRAHADAWRARLEAFREEGEIPEMEPRHVLEGTLPSVALAGAMNEALYGPQGPRALEDIFMHESDAPSLDDARLLGAAFFGTVGLRSARTAGRPQAKGLDRLAAVIGHMRWAASARGTSLAPDARALAARAGRAAVGDLRAPNPIEAERRDGGLIVLVHRRLPVALSDDDFAALAPLTSRAAADRLRDMGGDDGHEILADALASIPERRSFAAIAGVPAPATPSGELRHNARLYESAAASARPSVIVAEGRGGRAAHAIAMANASGAHVGYAAFDPLSREFRGRPLRAVYDLEGTLRGRLNQDEGGWRYLDGLPTEGFWTVPEKIST